MEAHARLGERPEALRQYDTLRATLERELGVEPLPETEALRAAILAGSLQPPHPPARRRRAGAPRHAGRGAAGALRGPRRRTGGAGRREETARGGQPRVVLLTGEVGIGKSRLWQRVGGQAAAGRCPCWKRAAWRPRRRCRSRR